MQTSWQRTRFGRLAVFIIGGLWLAQALGWGTSTLAFFAGRDNRLIAADEFHAIVPPGTTVAKFYRPMHDREIPIDETKYTLFIWHSKRHFIYNYATDKPIAAVADWPQYLMIQYEVGAIWEPPEQIEALQWREIIQASGQYHLVKSYPKRQWHGREWGVYGTRSRWAYLNPVVEVYARNN